ncbi:HAD-IA family hydrolase [Bacillus sp. BGMRC 2118]|nr:HAD-IA family hydrolase [Bacillus sp. BGMRC 2118]
MLFDLDDTLLDRNQAVENMFSLIVETCYGTQKQSDEIEMLRTFKALDKKDYGNRNKTNVFESFFDLYPTTCRLPRNDVQAFWNKHFPQCFTVNEHTIRLVNTIKMYAKVGMITNGTTQRQRAKIRNTHLQHCFDTIIISEEVGLSKPDKRIFELALSKLNVQPEETLFVGDDIERDIGGCQDAQIKGLWFNPHRIKNETDIIPYDEIHSIARVVRYVR